MKATALPAGIVSLYTSFSVSWKLLSIYPHTGKHSIWKTHAAVSQPILTGNNKDYFLPFVKDSSFETLEVLKTSKANQEKLLDMTQTAHLSVASPQEYKD